MEKLVGIRIGKRSTRFEGELDQESSCDFFERLNRQNWKLNYCSPLIFAVRIL